MRAYRTPTSTSGARAGAPRPAAGPCDFQVALARHCGCGVPAAPVAFPKKMLIGSCLLRATTRHSLSERLGDREAAGWRPSAACANVHNASTRGLAGTPSGGRDYNWLARDRDPATVRAGRAAAGTHCRHAHPWAHTVHGRPETGAVAHADAAAHVPLPKAPARTRPHARKKGVSTALARACAHFTCRPRAPRTSREPP